MGFPPALQASSADDSYIFYSKHKQGYGEILAKFDIAKRIRQNINLMCATDWYALVYIFYILTHTENKMLCDVLYSICIAPVV